MEVEENELVYNLYISLNLCLIGGKNLLVSSNHVDDAEGSMIQLLVETFGFDMEQNIRSINCDSKSSYKDLFSIIDKSTGAIILPGNKDKRDGDDNTSNIGDIDSESVVSDKSNISSSRISHPSILIFKNLDKTSQNFQVSLLETIRKASRLSHAESGVQFNQRIFIVIALVENINGSETPLYRYLQYSFWFRQSHFYDQPVSSSKSLSGVSLAGSRDSNNTIVPVSLKDIYSGRAHILKIAMVPEIRRYMYDILIFVRNHRMVTEGIPTRFIKDIELMIRCVGYINGYEYITPSLVKIASRKIYPLRINLVNYRKEVSLNWGSDLALTKTFVEKWDADIVIENVLSTVKPPL